MSRPGLPITFWDTPAGKLLRPLWGFICTLGMVVFITILMALALL